MKIRFLALAAALVAAQAQAITLPAGTPTLYVSGSSALTPVIAGIFATNVASGQSVNTYSNGSKDQWLYTATIAKNSTLGTKLGLTADTLVALFKRDAGGSAYGVNPIATGTAIDFLDETSLSATGANASATYKQVVPQLGAADVEPALLQQPENLVSGFTALTPTQLGSLKTTTMLLQSFGIGVNNNLYTALQAAQNTTGVPNITTGEIQSLVNAGGLTGASKTWGYLLNNGDTSQINICRRAPGSGTQSGANILFSPAGTTALRNSDSDNPAATMPASTGVLWVSESSGTGGVKTCLNNADIAGAGVYAIGYVGYENKPSGSDTWKFVTLDGQTADISNANIAKYTYAFENTFNYLKSLSTTSQTYKYIQGVLAAANSPTVFATLSPDLQSAAIQTSVAKATRGGNSRNPLIIKK